MQQTEIVKIKQLVSTSALLDPHEREEWLTLMGLMNDKQLLELEKILESNRQAPIAKPTPSAPPLGSLMPAKPSIVPEKKAPAPNFTAPNLSHIMNLPKVGAAFPHPAAQQGNSPAKPFTKPLAPKAPIGFWKKIKDVLAEKELPPGHKEPVDELGLIGPRTPVSLAPAVPPKKPVVPPPIKPVSEPAKIFAQNVYISPLPPPAGAVSKPDMVLPSKAAAEILAKKVLNSKESWEKPEDKLFMAGLKDTKVLMDAKFEAGRKKTEIAPAPNNAQKPQAVLGNKPRPDFEPSVFLRLLKVEDAAKLKAEDISAGGVQKLSEQLRGLIQANGFHKVTLALEKSPAYVSYIGTGTAVLSGKYDFSQPLSGAGKYMSREQFESFVDVLRKMKS